MSDIFTAGNGMVIHDEGTHISWASGFSRPFVTQALREYFQAERDTGLGLWRTLEYPRHAVWADPNVEGVVRVLNENSFTITTHARSGGAVAGFNGDLETGQKVARLYFDAHPPVGEPWHEAQVGEVWIAKFNGQPDQPAIIRDDGIGGCHFNFNGLCVQRDNPLITHAERIWPKEDDND